MSRAVVAALELTLTFAVIEVALLTVVEFTVIPEPENATAPPLTNPVPVIAMFWLLAPVASALGLAAVTPGAALIVNAPAPTAVELSGLVTVMLRVPVAADELTLTLAVIDVALLTVVEPTVTPDPETETTAPLSNPDPVIETDWLLAP
jgi:hypothetical protein